MNDFLKAYWYTNLKKMGLVNKKKYNKVIENIFDVNNYWFWYILSPNTNTLIKEYWFDKLINFMENIKEKWIKVYIPRENLSKHLVKVKKEDYFNYYIYHIPFNNNKNLKVILQWKEDKKYKTISYKVKLSVKVNTFIPKLFEEHNTTVNYTFIEKNIKQKRHNINITLNSNILDTPPNYNNINYIFTIIYLSKYKNNKNNNKNNNTIIARKFSNILFNSIIKDVKTYPIFIHKDILSKNLSKIEKQIIIKLYKVWELNKNTPHWYGSNSHLRDVMFAVKSYIINNIIKQLTEYKWNKIYIYIENDNDDKRYKIIYFNVLWRQLSFHIPITDINENDLKKINENIKKEEWVGKKTNENPLSMSNKRYNEFLNWKPKNIDEDYFWKNIMHKKIKKEIELFLNL